MIIDTHVHLDAINPVDPVIQRAGDAGVSRIVAVGMDITKKTNVQHRTLNAQH